jgi:hypothetical protein
VLFSWNIDHYSGINWTDWNQVWCIKSFTIIDSKTQRHRISMNFQHWNVLHLAVGLNMLLISSHWKWDFPLHMCHEICLCQNVVSPLEGHLFGTWSVDLAGRGSWSFGKKKHVQHIVSTRFNSINLVGGFKHFLFFHFIYGIIIPSDEQLIMLIYFSRWVLHHHNQISPMAFSYFKFVWLIGDFFRQPYGFYWVKLGGV